MLLGKKPLLEFKPTFIQVGTAQHSTSENHILGKGKAREDQLKQIPPGLAKINIASLTTNPYLPSTWEILYQMRQTLLAERINKLENSKTSLASYMMRVERHETTEMYLSCWCIYCCSMTCASAPKICGLASFTSEKVNSPKLNQMNQILANEQHCG